jgi:hypothetical protein
VKKKKLWVKKMTMKRIPISGSIALGMVMVKGPDPQ